MAGGFEPSEELRKELKNHVRKEIGALAVPDDIHFTTSLPKTRSGKIMRRLLRDIAAGRQTVGDTIDAGRLQRAGPAADGRRVVRPRISPLPLGEGPGVRAARVGATTGLSSSVRQPRKIFVGWLRAVKDETVTLCTKGHCWASQQWHPHARRYAKVPFQTIDTTIMVVYTTP